ncbi:hypothetical protein J7K24_03300 [bacterium]|nr:hypothetical protein [bacterium]
MKDTKEKEEKRKEVLETIRKSMSSVALMVFVFFLLSLIGAIFFRISLAKEIFIIEILWLLLTYPVFWIHTKIKTAVWINNFHLFWVSCELLFLTMIVHFLGSIAWIIPSFYLFFALHENFLFGKLQRVSMLFLTLGFFLGLVLLEFIGLINAYNIFFPSINVYGNYPYTIMTVLVMLGMIIFSFFTTNVFRRELREKIEEKIRINRDLIKTQESLRKANEELNKRIKMLEQIHKLTLDREMKMIELKEKIKKLQEKLKNKN